MIDGCLAEEGVREKEEHDVVIPLCKEAECLKL